MDIERTHRVGQQKEQQSRSVVVRFRRFSDREAVLRNCSKLRGTNIFIKEDLSSTSQAIKRDKMPLLRQARSEGKIAYFRHTKLIVKDRPGAARGGVGGSRSGDADVAITAVDEACGGIERTTTTTTTTAAASDVGAEGTVDFAAAATT